MPAPISEVSGSSPPGKPSESRRWLKPRVPRKQLYRLAAARDVTTDTNGVEPLN